MIDINIINKILILFYEEKVLQLEINIVIEELEISQDELFKITNLKKYFYFHNNLIILRNNLEIGVIQKRKLVDFLITPNSDIRLVFKAIAFDGDLVLMDLLNEKILIYLKRNLTHVIATVGFSKRNKQFYSLEGVEEFHLELTENLVFEAGSIIYVEINDVNKDKIIGTYIKTIAHKNDPDAEMLKIIYKYGWPAEFENEVLNEANNLIVNYEDEYKERQDLTNLLTVTIDGEDAKDLDDAISLEKLANGYKVGIHIADVSYFVKKDSKLDEAAKERGTSLYVVDRVIPMLPPIISNYLGSLNVGEKRLTISILITFDLNWQVVDYEIVKSYIKVSNRLSYTEVNKLFKTNEFSHSEDVKEMLLSLYELSKHLLELRVKNGMIEFSSTELKFITKNKKVIDIEKRESDDAERLIEVLMIQANEIVATHLNNLNYPSVYRIHEKPKLDKLEESIKTIERLGFKSQTKDFSNPKNIQRLTELAKNTRYYKIVNMLILKAMMRAKYVSYKDIHYGLNLQAYTHFTAPIRRYPDLILHRLIHELLFEEGNFSKKFNYYEKYLPGVLDKASKQERQAIEISRDVEKLASIEYLNNNLDKTYKGQIVSVLPSGMFIELTNGIEGFCALRNLNHYYYYFEESLNYVNDFGTEYKLGDFVLVEYIGFNIERLEIDFKIIKKV